MARLIQRGKAISEKQRAIILAQIFWFWKEEGAELRKLSGEVNLFFSRMNCNGAEHETLKTNIRETRRAQQAGQLFGSNEMFSTLG